MRIRHETRSGQLLLALAAWVLRLTIQLLGRTWRVEVTAGKQTPPPLSPDADPVVLTFWHNRGIMAAHFLRHHVHRRGFDVTLLASHSRDGELVARTVRPWGVHIVRGSATRGGREAMWGTYRAIRKKRSSPVLIPDGPTGPLYRYKPGVLSLAALAGAPLLPLGFAAERFWTIGSWDRLIVPKPFSRVAVTVGPPQAVPPGLSGPELESERARQEQLLNAATLEAEEALGLAGPPEARVRQTAD